MMESKLVTFIAAVVVLGINRLVGEVAGVELLDGETVQYLAVVVSGFIVGKGISERGK